MEDLIKYVEINNFKSIKHLNLDDCKRINLFIGYPNVGKSNIKFISSCKALLYQNKVLFSKAK